MSDSFHGLRNINGVGQAGFQSPHEHGSYQRKRQECDKVNAAIIDVDAVEGLVDIDEKIVAQGYDVAENAD